MIICTACGATNGDDDQFCGACGEFLRWDAGAGTSAGGAGDRAPAGRPADDGPPAGHPAEGRPAVDTRVGTGPDAGARARATGPGTDAGPPPPTVDVPTPVAASTSGDTHRSDADVPPRQPPDGSGTGDRAGGGAQPAPRQPGPPERRGQGSGPEPVPVESVDPTARPPVPRLVCPACAVDNDPGRRFCRACGTQLSAPAAVTPRRTWWQRWWDRLRRRAPRRSQREERRASRAARLSLLIVLVLCLVGVLAVAGPPLARRTLEAVRDRTEDPTPLVPASVAASSEMPGAGAAKLTDGANNRYWAPNGKAVDAWVEGRFNEPVRLLTVVITPGVGPRRQAFLAAGRPRGLTVVTVAADGTQQKTDIELRDEPGEQHFEVEASKVARIRLVVRSTYGPGLIPSVAIGEAEFFGRR
ncbi:hypothetical protein AB0K20_30865 [Micromonospora matsumotoense]|uniref:NADase-type glycan-binding domain-containing protein n=1 Tax=Micromonospora matsumotoense TaxID=121616 RepID=UPI003432E189